MSDKLAKPIKPVGSFGLNARRSLVKQDAITDITKFPNRISIVFDDSGSMGGQPIADAKKAVEGFLQATNPNDTAIAIVPLNKTKQPLSNNPGLVLAYTMGIDATGGTPIFRHLKDILTENVTSRVVLFSDGEPTDRNGYDYNRFDTDGSSHYDELDVTAPKFKAAGIPIDTVYIGDGDSKFMKELAERTGGIYLHFTDTSVFGKNLKYLAPKNRHLLLNGETRKAIESGKM